MVGRVTVHKASLSYAHHVHLRRGALIVSAPADGISQRTTTIVRFRCEFVARTMWCRPIAFIRAARRLPRTAFLRFGAMSTARWRQPVMSDEHLLLLLLSILCFILSLRRHRVSTFFLPIATLREGPWTVVISRTRLLPVRFIVEMPIDGTRENRSSRETLPVIVRTKFEYSEGGNDLWATTRFDKTCVHDLLQKFN